MNIKVQHLGRDFSRRSFLHRVNTVIFTLLALGAAAFAAQQSSPPAPAQQSVPQPGAPQESSPTPAKPPAPPVRVGVPAYPVRPPADPAVVQRGRQIFSANCSFCHGSDARGGEGGPNLVRSQLVMDDHDGEQITPVVQNGRPDKGMPKFDLTAEQVGNIATFLHSIPVGGRAAITGTVNPLVGDAKAGEAYFNGGGKCNTCHSVTGDLDGIGARYPDPRALQGAVLSGERRGESLEEGRKTVVVTLRGGQTLEGRLYKIDDFIVSFVDANGDYHSFPRHGDDPKVVIKDRLQPHLDMLGSWKDDDIHNVTAYLVTLQ
jgi:cytochrome c oxidase cbb3-type subunit III